MEAHNLSGSRDRYLPLVAFHLGPTGQHRGLDEALDFTVPVQGLQPPKANLRIDAHILTHIIQVTPSQARPDKRHPYISIARPWLGFPMLLQKNALK